MNPMSTHALPTVRTGRMTFAGRTATIPQHAAAMHRGEYGDTRTAARLMAHWLKLPEGAKARAMAKAAARRDGLDVDRLQAVWDALE